MPNLTVKNVPESIYSRLKESAQIHHRSMNSEILYCIERTIGTHQVTVSQYLESARKLRQKTNKNQLTDKQLDEMKTQGRA